MTDQLGDLAPVTVAGAYPAAAALDPSCHGDEERFWRTILEDENVDGLEIPFADGLHRDERWFLDLLPEGSRHVVTAVPITAMRVRDDPRFGLASTDAEGRAAAVGVAEEVRAAVRRIFDSGASVLAVEIQSAPNRVAEPGAGSAEALAASLADLADRDWCGAALVIEHCDAPTAGHSAQKGFLTLDDELKVVAHATSSSGVVINWARSVIEGRDPQTAVRHVVAAAERLRGVMFSGVADGGKGDWLDAHLPPADGDPTSLLTAERMLGTLRAVGTTPPSFIGAKVAARTSDRDAADRAAGVLAAVHQVRAAWERR